MTRIRQNDLGAGVQERQFAQAMLERREIEFRDVVKRLGARQKRNFGAALAVCVADDLERRHGIAVAELDEVFLALAPDAALEPARKRVDDGNADAVQTARHLVGILVELAARVQLGENDLGRRTLRHLIVVLLDAGRNSAPVVAHRARPVGVERHLAHLRMAGENLVDAVVDDLVDHVMQTRSVVGVADVHAGAFADRVEPLQHLDAVLAVVLRRRRFLQRLSVHSGLSQGTEFECSFYSTNRPETPHEIATIRREKTFIFHRVVCDRLSLFDALIQKRDFALLDPPKSGPPRQRIEGIRIRSRHPRLGAETQNFFKQRRPPVAIEMRRDLIEQQDRCRPFLPLRQQLCMRQDEPEQQRFLLSRRAMPRGERLGSVLDERGRTDAGHRASATRRGRARASR